MPFWKWLAFGALALSMFFAVVAYNWLWVKTKVALGMECIGVNWTDPQQVTDGDKLNFTVGAGVNFFAVLLTAVGVWLALEQRWAAQREAQRKAVLSVVLPNPPSYGGKETERYQLYIQNDGDKAGSGFWYLGIPKRMRGRVTIEPSSGNEEVPFPNDNWDIYSDFDQPEVISFTDDFYLVKFLTTRAVEPGVMMPCAIVSVTWNWERSEWLGHESIEARDQSWRIFGWFTKGPSGRVPATGMTKLRMYSDSDPTFKTQHGGVELPWDDPDKFY